MAYSLNKLIPRKGILSINMNDSKLYCCFSVPLRDFLIKNGLRYEICACSPKTGNMMWVFIRTPLLNKLLSEWSSH